MVVWRGQEAGDDQLPHLQAGARRAVLRQDLRPGQGLRVPVREVQAPEAPRGGLREVRGGGRARQGAPGADGPHRAREPGRPHLVSQVPPVAHRAGARHDPPRDRAGPLLRGLRGGRAGHDGPRAGPAPHRRDVPRRARAVRGRLRRPHGRGGDPRAAADHGPRGRDREGAVGARDDRLGSPHEEAHQAPQAPGRSQEFRQQAGMDGAQGAARAAAGASPARAPRRRAVRHLRPERPLPAGHQPQQPAEAPARPQRARDHRAQREADAAGVGGRPPRQRPPGARHHRLEQAGPEVARGHDQGQAGALPPEPARQAGRLLGKVRDRGRADPEAPPVRPAQEDGPRAVPAVRVREARDARARDHHQGREEARGARRPGGVGHPGGGDPRAPGPAQPRPHPAPPRHPGLRARARRRQGDPAPSPGVRRVQRRLRRRSDGGARAALDRGPARSAHPDDVHQQHPLAGARGADHRADPGRGAGALLHDPGGRRREGRGVGVLGHRGGAPGVRGRGGRAPCPHPGPDPGGGPRGRRTPDPGRDDGRAKPPLRRGPGRHPVRGGQPGHEQAGHLGPHRHLLPAGGPQGDGRLRGPAHVHRVQLRDPLGNLYRGRGHGDPSREARHPREGRRGGEGGRGAVPVRLPDQRRALQQGGRHLVPDQRPGGGSHDGEDRLRGSA